MRNELNDIITNPNLSDEEKRRRIGELNMEELGRNHNTLTNEDLFKRLDNDPYIYDYDRNSLLSAYTEKEINQTGLFDNILEKYGITNKELLEYAKYLRKELGIDNSQQQNAPVASNINENELFKKLDKIIPETHKRVLAAETDVNKLPKHYLDHLVDEYKSAENGFDANDLKRYATYLKEKQNHIENKPNNIDDEINKIEKERQTLVKRFKPKEQKFEKLKNDESELEQDFEKENEEDENEIISTRDGEYLSKKDRFVKWVKNLPLSVKIGACVAGAVALGAAIYHFTQGDAQPLSDIIQNTADTINNTAQHVSEQVSNHGSIDISSLGEAFKEIPVYEDTYQAANLEQPLEPDPIWFQKGNPVAGYTANAVEIPYNGMPSDDFVQQMKDGVIKTVKYGMDANGNSSGYVNAEKLLEVAEKTAGGRTL